MSERKQITMAQARANALEDVDKEIARAERERADEMADADLEYDELHEGCDMEIEGLETRIAELERHQAEDQRAILALRASARAQCYTAAQHDVATAIEHQNQKAIDRAVMDNIQRAREQT